MKTIPLITQQLREFPEYLLALKGAAAVLLIGLPVYLALRYFIYRRRLTISFGTTLNFLSVFILFAGLAFLLASPLEAHLRGPVITAYLFLTCVVAALNIVSLIDIFVVQHYLAHVKQLYVSPPLRTVIKIGVFCFAILPILRFVLHFNPLALVAIPTIATAGLALALQDTLKTFIAGVGLGHIIRIGDWIAFGDKEGRVIDINWARTVLQTPTGNHIFIPNSQLQTGVFVNYSAISPSTQDVFKVSAAYDAPPAHVKDTLARCADSAPGVLKSPAATARLLEYADSGIVYGLYYWVDDYAQKPLIQNDVATRVWYAFQREHITIPYPVRTVHLERAADRSAKSRSHIEEALQQWVLAGAFYFEELRELSFWTQKRVYAPGETVIQKGAAGESLFAIVQGQAEVFVSRDGGSPLATLGPKEIFGEMSLLTGAPRSATVKAKTSLEVLEIEKSGLQKILAKRPELSDKLAQLIVERQAVLTARPNQSSEEAEGNGIAETHESLTKSIRQFFGLA